MAAPSSTVWGDIKNGNGRIGIYVNSSSTNTTTTTTVQIWFWTIYSCEDGHNHLYYNADTDITAATTEVASVNISHTVATGAGWSTSNQTKLFEKTYTHDRGTSAVTYKAYAKFTSVDYVGTAMYANTSFTIPALASYTIKYNANGGSNAPASQTKWYGKNLTLSSVKPTRAGYSFQGWALSLLEANAGTWYYQPGGTCAKNENLTLYAVWKANTYSVKYNANGGSGAPDNQTKTYGVALTLSSVIPTRANYNFLGWGTSASTSTVSYNAGSKYTSNANITLYAVWELAYVRPSIYNFTAVRCDASGNEKPNGDGTYALVKFNWKTTYDVTNITIAWSSSANSDSTDVSASGTSGSVSQIIGDDKLLTDVSYTLTVTVADNTDNTPLTYTLHGAIFAIDFLAGGKGVGFGKSAELEGVADFALDAKFNNPVYGNVMGLNRLPEIPSGADLDDYMLTGSWAVYSNTIAETIANMPVARAGRLEVNSATGEGIRAEQWSYLRQKFIPYQVTYPTYERDITRSSDNTWTYGPWYRTTLATNTQKLLWSGEYYMSGSQTATLSEPVSMQPNGIVLVFSGYYNGAATNANFTTVFIPKKLVAMHDGLGVGVLMAGTPLNPIGHKYVYVYNTQITGHSNNEWAGTSSTGIAAQSNAFVLRYVIGV